MTEDQRRRHEFTQILMSELANYWRADETRIDRTRVEEMGRQVGLDPEEAREVFVAAKGDIWEGEFVESDEEPGWEAIVLENVPASGPPPTRGIS